ncbi:MAG: hypothetical protein ACNS63_05865 [Candidatus Nitrospinota bacterium M3_3B_026]
MSLEDVYILLPYILAFLILLWIFKKKIQERGEVDRKWRMFAAERGLSEEGKGSFVFTGENEGMPFILDVHIVSAGDTSTTYTRMRVAPPDLPAGFRLRPESRLSRLGKALGTMDVETGDPEFDKTFIVKGDNPEQVRTYLDPDRRHILLRGLKEFGAFEIKEGRLQVERSGLIKDLSELERLFARLGDLAAALARP